MLTRCQSPALSDSIASVFYVYVLKDPESDELYYGYTRDLRMRFKAHQRDPKHAGWRLAYCEAYADEQDARERERMLKQYGAARGHLKRRIARSISASLRG